MTPRDLESLVIETWDFANPAASETAFRTAAATHADGSVEETVMLTQVARAQGLQKEYDEANVTLSAAEFAAAELPEGTARDHALARVAIERGRVLNSAGDPTTAEPYFESAFDLASKAGTGGLAVDALHMRAIVASQIDTPEASRAMNERALGIADSSPDPAARRWRASLLNNLGWDLHSAGDFEGALVVFERAFEVRIENGAPTEIAVARWCIARTLRSLGRLEEALDIQQRLYADPVNASDGYIPQEIAAILTELGRAGEAAPYAARAAELLGDEA